jgi:hypothetical protein
VLVSFIGDLLTRHPEHRNFPSESLLTAATVAVLKRSPAWARGSTRR